MPPSSAAGKVVIFFTGGTIGMSRQPGQGVAPAGDFSELLAEMAPHVQGVELEPVHWSSLPSPHLTPEDMFRLARDVEAALADPQTLGAVVSHGTDVLEESAFMADLVIRSDKPVVYTGSMRFFREAGYDGIRNLVSGVDACRLPLPPGTGVVLLMADRFFAAREVVKVHSMNIDAFDAPESGPVAQVVGEQVVLAGPPAQGGRSYRPLLEPERIDPRVPLVSCYTGMDGGILEYLASRPLAGLVLEGFGAGNVPPGILPALEGLLERGLPVVLATRCLEGGAWPIYGYPGGGADLKRRGVILSGHLSGVKARILLMVALGAGMNTQAIRPLFED